MQVKIVFTNYFFLAALCLIFAQSCEGDSGATAGNQPDVSSTTSSPPLAPAPVLAPARPPLSNDSAKRRVHPEAFPEKTGIVATQDVPSFPKVSMTEEWFLNEITKLGTEVWQGYFGKKPHNVTFIIDNRPTDEFTAFTIASYDSDTITFRLDGVKRLADSFPSEWQEGIAFVIGHEFAHSINKDKSSAFNGDEACAINNPRYFDKELAADAFAMKAAFRAGFTKWSNYKVWIKRIHDACNQNMSQASITHPSGTKRTALIDSAALEVEAIIHCWHAANALTLAGEYQWAEHIYSDFIDTDRFSQDLPIYEGPEVFHNRAVNALLQKTSRKVDDKAVPLKIYWPIFLRKHSPLVRQEFTNLGALAGDDEASASIPALFDQARSVSDDPLLKVHQLIAHAVENQASRFEGAHGKMINNRETIHDAEIPLHQVADLTKLLFILSTSKDHQSTYNSLSTGFRDRYTNRAPKIDSLLAWNNPALQKSRQGKKPISYSYSPPKASKNWSQQVTLSNLEVSWHYPNPNNHVEVDLLITYGQEKSIQLYSRRLTSDLKQRKSINQPAVQISDGRLTVLREGELLRFDPDDGSEPYLIGIRK